MFRLTERRRVRSIWSHTHAAESNFGFLTLCVFGIIESILITLKAGWWGAGGGGIYSLANYTAVYEKT